MATEQFYAIEPSLENYWRSIILFGRNVASYKFALGKALLEQGPEKGDLVRLEDLAPPFARYICEHLALSDKQGTSASSRFLDACRSFNRGEMAEDGLIGTTTRLGFQNVIDAFHVVNAEEIPIRFFEDERSQNKAIRITENLHALRAGEQSPSLPLELESRWRLVETAWDLGIGRNAIAMGYDPVEGRLEAITKKRRTAVTSCRSALNGYQKGRCFYCFASISIARGSDLTDVDHFFPHVLKGSGVAEPIDGIWNLVLACQDCNRGEGGKFARVPSLELLERLSRRNEYLVGSHHPLRETLILQTCLSAQDRRQFLQSTWNQARNLLIHTWCPSPRAPATF